MYSGMRTLDTHTFVSRRRYARYACIVVCGRQICNSIPAPRYEAVYTVVQCLCCLHLRIPACTFAYLRGIPAPRYEAVNIVAYLLLETLLLSLGAARYLVVWQHSSMRTLDIQQYTCLLEPLLFGLCAASSIKTLDLQQCSSMRTLNIKYYIPATGTPSPRYLCCLPGDVSRRNCQIKSLWR